ncbi:MAG: hypothetical protein OEZ43_20060 [Gammaproteobacteria bacterium]|nr:hypothetical protein [Gammaproteobacteria bacterium]
MGKQVHVGKYIRKYIQISLIKNPVRARNTFQMQDFDRYKKSDVLKSARFLLFGRVLSASLGLLLILLLVRELSLAEYGAYTVFNALIEVIAVISGFGIAHAFLRYVPELYSIKKDGELRGVLLLLGVFRITTLVAFALVALYYAGEFTEKFTFGAFEEEFRIYILVIVLRVIQQMVFQILETLLAQGIAQLGYFLGALIKILCFLYFLKSGEVGLLDVIVADIIGDTISMIVMIGGLAFVLYPKNRNKKMEFYWFFSNIKRMLYFMLTAYLQNVLVLMYGSSSNRLVFSHYSNGESVASLGLSQAIVDIFRRYLPVQFLFGVIRTYSIACYVKDRDMSNVVNTSNILLKINSIVLLILAIWISSIGESIVYSLTEGKYGSDAINLLLLFLLVLLFETKRILVEMAAQILERYKIFVYTNVALSLSILLAIPFINKYGAMSVVVANVVGLVISNYFSMKMVSNYGTKYRCDWSGSSKLVLVTFLVLTTIELVKGNMIIDIIVAAVCSISSLLVLWRMKYFDNAQLATLKAIIRFKGQSVNN